MTTTAASRPIKPRREPAAVEVPKIDLHHHHHSTTTSNALAASVAATAVGKISAPYGTVKADLEPEDYDAVSLAIIAVAHIIAVLTCPLFFIYLKVIRQYERAVVQRLGRLRWSAVGPGIIFRIPFLDRFTRIDLRTKLTQITIKEVLVKELVAVDVDVVMHYRIFDATLAVMSVENVDASTRLLAQATLRTALASRRLTEVLTNRQRIADELQTTLTRSVEAWGTRVERVELKDIRLPRTLQRALAAEAETAQEARVRLAAAKGECRVTEALRDAARVFAAAPGERAGNRDIEAAAMPMSVEMLHAANSRALHMQPLPHIDVTTATSTHSSSQQQQSTAPSHLHHHNHHFNNQQLSNLHHHQTTVNTSYPPFPTHSSHHSPAAIPVNVPSPSHPTPALAAAASHSSHSPYSHQQQHQQQQQQQQLDHEDERPPSATPTETLGVAPPQAAAATASYARVSPVAYGGGAPFGW